MTQHRHTSKHVTAEQVQAWEKTKRDDGLGLCQVCRQVWTIIAGICSQCEFEKANRLAPRG